jgi:electron transport complex protein RnfC
LEDYTKFRLKKKDELVPFLQDKDKLFVVACNKCFKEFELGDEPESAAFQAIAAEQGKTIVGCMNIDFLCNSTLTMKKLQLPAEAQNAFVISCGLGIQTVAGFAELPVYAACDSIPTDGMHGMALTKRRCEACGQCYLNLTGGICPIVDCSKSLVNGQCGGCKKGKCEVDSNKDCAWENIHRRLEKQGRVPDYLNQGTHIRNYQKANFAFVNNYVKSIRESRFEGYYGGIHPSERKEISEHSALQPFPPVKTVVIPLHQHTGAPAQPLVEAGASVQMGQKIGEPGGFVSAAIHASVSGKVIAVEPRKHPVTGADVLSVVIENDGKDTVHESVKPAAGSLDNLSIEDIVNIVREKGIVGMGGAAFPTSVKLQPSKPIDTVLLNGCECEPLLTADHWEMLAYADDIIFGLKVLLKTVKAEKGIIVIEDNKHDAIELMESKVAGIPNMEVVVAKTKYPQGAEKMLIKRVMNRWVPSGGLPMDVGCVVNNVSTAKAISDAIQKGMPLVERVVTVSGERIKNPGNFIVRIGTPVRELIEHCGGVVGSDVTIKLGGPMMGFECSDLDVPVIKGNNGIIAIETALWESADCIKCGRCVDVCPMELLPLYFPKYAGEENWAAMNEKSVRDCIECRCCEYICSSKIPLVHSIKTGKTGVANMVKK